MRVRDILEADSSVDRIEITVMLPNGKFVADYFIGRDINPPEYYRYRYSAKIGDVYDNQGRKCVFINRIIQHYQLDKKFRKTAKSYGVLFETIPKELLDLEIFTMTPCYCDGSDILHGYYFICQANTWEGIYGEEI